MVVETTLLRLLLPGIFILSVSSDGSWWLKRGVGEGEGRDDGPFSILGRIVVVETIVTPRRLSTTLPFSILGRIVVVETIVVLAS